MACGPSIPFHHDGTSRRNRGGSLSVGGALVADDVAAPIGIWSYISKISCVFGPTDRGRRVGFVGILGNKISGVTILS